MRKPSRWIVWLIAILAASTIRLSSDQSQAAYVLPIPCTGSVTLSYGLGTFSNSCVSSTVACEGRDATNPAVIVGFEAYQAGSVMVTGANSDVIQIRC